MNLFLLNPNRIGFYYFVIITSLVSSFQSTRTPRASAINLIGSIVLSFLITGATSGLLDVNVKLSNFEAESGVTVTLNESSPYVLSVISETIINHPTFLYSKDDSGNTLQNRDPLSVPEILCTYIRYLHFCQVCTGSIRLFSSMPLLQPLKPFCPH